jgi:hypothetical protein
MLRVLGAEVGDKAPLRLSAAKDTAEKDSHRPAEAIVYKKQDDESKYKHPEKTHDYFQRVENKPQGQQAGDEGDDRVFN